MKKIAIASIQILGEDGRVMARELKGVNDLKELSSITVSGVVDQSSTEENFLINAKQIHVDKK